ncbi:MAG: Asp-tRNA(Asn)/Glu-tRNA(Gln) amidotransferase subunit GatB [Chitinophagaceae bacterium]
MPDYHAYEIVVGLEVHAQLQTDSKLFCGDSTVFGQAPNTAISQITLAHPGTLPKMNKKAIELAVRLGLACHCQVTANNYFARKNYFYPDLPKGYQVSQHTTPVCSGGFILISTTDGGEKKIRLNRIHMEEDAGKSIHDADENNTCIDLNRAGTPLVEIVTEPDLRSAEEAFAFLTEIRRLVRYLDICDGNMEEGSLRCDANISVRRKGEEALGTKVEVKNLNSVRNVKRAIEAESKRLIAVIEAGGVVQQQTRSFDANTGTTFSIRDKEDADDYRYFPEPDLAPFQLSEDFIAGIRSKLPVLRAERMHRYISQYQLSEYDAAVLTDEREVADYFEEITRHTGNRKAAANWMLGPVKNWMNENNEPIGSFPLQPLIIARVIDLIDSGKISFTAAASRLFSLLLVNPEEDPGKLAETNHLVQQSDMSAIGPVIDAVLAKFAGKAEEYKKGKKGLLSLFVGEVMKQTKGKADPKMVNEVLAQKLKS